VIVTPGQRWPSAGRVVPRMGGQSAPRGASASNSDAKAPRTRRALPAGGQRQPTPARSPVNAAVDVRRRRSGAGGRDERVARVAPTDDTRKADEAARAAPIPSAGGPPATRAGAAARAEAGRAEAAAPGGGPGPGRLRRTTPPRAPGPAGASARPGAPPRRARPSRPTRAAPRGTAGRDGPQPVVGPSMYREGSSSPRLGSARWPSW
jgi:hypothetical protein